MVNIPIVGGVVQVETFTGLITDATLSGNGKTTSLSVVASPWTRVNSVLSTVTSNAILTLTSSSVYNQIFTGSLNHGCKMPVTSTLSLGFAFNIVNESTGMIAVYSSDGTSIVTIPTKQSAELTCLSTSINTNYGWQFKTNQNIPPVSSGEKVLTETSSGVYASYETIEMIIDATSLTAASWTGSTLTLTGTQGQVAYDTYYRYDCIATNTWKRTYAGVAIDLYAGTIDDSTAKTSTDLQIAFPSSVIGQRVRGINYLYEKYDTVLWFKIAKTDI